MPKERKQPKKSKEPKTKPSSKDSSESSASALTEKELACRGLAEFFHKTYEKLAPSFGYETRKDTRKFNPNSSNGMLMTAVAEKVLDRLAEQAPTVLDLDTLQSICTARSMESFSKSAEWSLLEWTGALCGESGEASNVAKKIVTESKGGTFERLGEELADTVIYAVLVASAGGINLAQSIVEKFNRVSKKKGSNFVLPKLRKGKS